MGAVVTAVPLPGSTAAALVIAPLVADTVTDAANTLLGHQIDKSTDDAEDDPLVPSQMASQKFYGRGTEHLDYRGRPPYKD
ncbi:hypothetical protein ACWEHT_07535 [Streptomyces sp. NPDC004646]